MLRPVYLHGPPVAKQTKSLRLASRRGALVLANFLLMRVSASTFPAKSSTTAEIASLPPRRSKSDPFGAGAAAGAEATGAPFSPSGGAGLKFAGRSVPVWGDSFSTMSFLNPASAPSSSFCSAAGTLNLFSVLTRSSTSAVNSPAVVPIFLWDSFILRPVYRHGPPVAKQTKSLRLASKRAGSLLPNFLLMRGSLSTFPAKSSTTSEIASLPPRRSKSDFGWANAKTERTVSRHRPITMVLILFTFMSSRMWMPPGDCHPAQWKRLSEKCSGLRDSILRVNFVRLIIPVYGGQVTAGFRFSTASGSVPRRSLDRDALATV